jgi:hypothetical protein
VRTTAVLKIEKAPRADNSRVIGDFDFPTPKHRKGVGNDFVIPLNSTALVSKLSRLTPILKT